MTNPLPSTITNQQPLSPPSPEFTPEEVAQFQRDGFIIARGLADPHTLETMRQATEDGLRRVAEPVEFEAELSYPGAPDSMLSEGGRTLRRLKQAHSRGMIFTEWLCTPGLTGRLRQLLGPDVVMPLAHHNCIMTKMPRYSSDTGWHRDIRYWSYQRGELVSTWLALGSEHPENGCLRLLPGTHRIDFTADRLDPAKFLRTDHPQNRPLLEREVCAELEPGDVLFFHCRAFHAATRNRTQEPKFSVVFTFRPADNPPLPATRSATLPELIIP